ncbi:MAG: sigma-70 family RNA polymerase sigma factor [Myxococcales bacterium]|nr:sigma-70 family RNA polymerase sigma factor [Myxococcales bacterium]
MDTDFQLLEAWRAGDRAAGTELFNRHFNGLYRFFRNKVGDDADDLVQQTFLAVVKARDRFRGDSSFRTYLFTAARSKLYNHFSRKRPDQRDRLGVTSVIDLGVSMHRMMVKSEEQRLLLEGLRALPLDLQVALELHYFEGMRGPALAEVLEIPEGTVRSRLRRGRERLRDELERLSASSERAATTMTNLDGWAAQIREILKGQ